MSTETPYPSPRPPRGRRWWDVALPAAGILAVAVGMGLMLWSVLWDATHPASFGWTAYAPLSSTVYRPYSGSLLLEWGVVSVALGAVVLAFWAGLLLGRRAR